MAVVGTSPHAFATDTDATFYTSDSYTPTSNTLQLLSVLNSRSGASATVPTVSGCSLTWTQIATVAFATGFLNQRRITMFRALAASPTTGVLLVDFAGVTQTGGILQGAEFSGVATGGTNGSEAALQVVTAAEDASDVTSLSVSLAAFGSSNNRTFAACGHNMNEAKSPRASWTELRDPAASLGAPQQNMTIQWSDAAGADTTASASWATGSRCGIIAVEVSETLGAAGSLLYNPKPQAHLRAR